MGIINTVKYILNNYWVVIFGGIVGVVREDIIGTLSLVVTVLIFIRQTKDSKERDRVEKYRRNPYFYIELETLMEYSIKDNEGIITIGEDDMGIEEYTEYHTKEISEVIEGMHIDMTNIGFNWVKVLGVKYKIEVREDLIKDFNETMKELTGTEDIEVYKRGFDGRYVLRDKLKRGISDIKIDTEWAILGMYTEKHSGKGQEYKIEPTEDLMKAIIMGSKLSNIAEYVANKERRSVYIPKVYDIKLKVVYVNSDEEKESIKCDTYYGLSNPYGRYDIKEDEYGGRRRYWYRYMFEREDKYNDFMKIGEEKELNSKKDTEGDNKDTTVSEKVKLEYEPISNNKEE